MQPYGQNVKRINHYAVQLLMYTCSLCFIHCNSTLLNGVHMRMQCIFASETVASCSHQINCLTTKKHFMHDKWTWSNAVSRLVARASSHLMMEKLSSDANLCWFEPCNESLSDSGASTILSIDIHERIESID